MFNPRLKKAPKKKQSSRQSIVVMHLEFLQQGDSWKRYDPLLSWKCLCGAGRWA